MNAIKFAEYVLKPWEELNILLLERSAFQPELSSAIRCAGDLAVAIRHLPEAFTSDEHSAKLLEKSALRLSASHTIVCDVADAWKHHQPLRNPSRMNKLCVAAQFESVGSRFRFLRNAVQIQHATYGVHDFMIVARDAIKYWITNAAFTIKWVGEIREAGPDFHDTAFLYFNPKHQVVHDRLQLQMYRRVNGCLEPFDPPEVRFELLETSEG